MYRCKMRLISGQCANSPLFRRSVKWPLLPIHLKPRTSNLRTCILLNVRQSNRKPVQRIFRHSLAISSNHKTVFCNFERGGRGRTGPPDSVNSMVLSYVCPKVRSSPLYYAKQNTLLESGSEWQKTRRNF